MKQKGFSMILVILTMLLVSIPISFAAVYLTIGEAQVGLAFYRGERALLLSESCGEDVLLRLRTDSQYVESSISLPEGNCDVSVTENGDERTVVVTAEREGYERTVEIKVEISPAGLLLQKWIEQPL